MSSIIDAIDSGIGEILSNIPWDGVMILFGLWLAYKWGAQNERMNWTLNMKREIEREKEIQSEWTKQHRWRV
jgi:hypothetical protein